MNPSMLPFSVTDRPLHVLVVDDQEFDRRMIAARLTEAFPKDLTIQEASTGAQALSMLEESAAPFDCVLLDMNLPDTRGSELITKLRAHSSDLCIVMITVESAMEKALLCLSAGAEDFLIKGEYSNIGLYRTIHYAMERTRSAIEHRTLQESLHRARELNQAQKEFVHLVSHEFRTPIAIISGAMQLLATKAPEFFAGPGAAHKRKIEEAITRLVALLDNVLRLSMVEDGKEVFSPTAFDMTHAVRQVCQCFDMARLECALDPTDAAISFHGDQRLVEYAIHNVISNALKYSPSGSKVRVRMEMNPQSIAITVKDEGPGMSKEMIARAGEKFYRDKKTSHIEGTGLGLHLTRRFMEYHGGTLTYESEEGSGTLARLIFPHG